MNVPLMPQQLLQQRAQVVHLALKYGGAFGLKEVTTYDGLMLFDRATSCGAPFNTSLWPLCLCSCLLMAAHQVISLLFEPSVTRACVLCMVVTNLLIFARQVEVGGASSWRTYEQITLLTGFATEALTGMERNVFAWLHQVGA